MACETKSKAINDHEYSVTQWPAEKALLMKFKLTKAFGPSIAAVMGSNIDTSQEALDNVENTSAEPELNAFGAALTALFQSSSPEELLALLKECVIGVGCDGKRITETTFNELFSGDNLTQVYAVFMFVLETNYSNLFKGQQVQGLLARFKQSK